MDTCIAYYFILRHYNELNSNIIYYLTKYIFISTKNIKVSEDNNKIKNIMFLQVHYRVYETVFGPHFNNYFLRLTQGQREGVLIYYQYQYYIPYTTGKPFPQLKILHRKIILINSILVCANGKPVCVLNTYFFEGPFIIVQPYAFGSLLQLKNSMFNILSNLL